MRALTICATSWMGLCTGDEGSHVCTLEPGHDGDHMCHCRDKYHQRPDPMTILSLELEEATGFDSIPTVERYMRNEAGKIPCPFPKCQITRNYARAMWRHIHFSIHGHSFGVGWADIAWKRRLQAVADAQNVQDAALDEPERSETTPPGTQGTPKSSERHTE